MSGFLRQACADARQRVVEAARLVPLAQLQTSPAPAVPSLAGALAAPGVGVIAEVKRASPSRGHIAWVPNPAAHAAAYARGGACAISVLTEPAHFHGTLGDLEAVAAAVAVPVIRKDFLVDAYQVWEARRAGASAALLIVAALDDHELVALLRACDEARIEALVEVHDVSEARRAGAALEVAGPARPVVGVNARDMATLQVDPHRFAACVAALPRGCLAVAESGIDSPDAVRRAGDAGADAVLVGEHLAAAIDPEAATRALATATVRTTA
ncbi:MAG: indole-3-glycerol phosphate synthase TrpC [Egibacteraceae bacterium]